MPELPEVETVIWGLQPTVEGRMLTTSEKVPDIHFKHVLHPLAVQYLVDRRI